jgi:hypothetical protein
MLNLNELKNFITIEWCRLKNNSERSLAHLYDPYIQLLYNYGMHACHDHDQVINALRELFGDAMKEGELCVPTRTIRFCLFKRLRDLIIQQRVASGKSNDLFTANGLTLMQFQSQRQREAIFLKLSCAFSYHETAAIMGLNSEWVYNLVAQAIAMVRGDLKDFSQNNAYSTPELV